MKTNTIRTELNKYAQQIENLAHEVQSKLAVGGDPLLVANELVRNSSTFVFVLGQMYALEDDQKTKTITVNGQSRKYHNVRDAFGRFTRA